MCTGQVKFTRQRVAYYMYVSRNMYMYLSHHIHITVKTLFPCSMACIVQDAHMYRGVARASDSTCTCSCRHERSLVVVDVTMRLT